MQFAALEFAGVSTGKLSGITCSLGAGEIAAVLGPDRAGVEALCDVALGIRRPQTGTVRIGGAEPRTAARDGLVGSLSRHGGLMPEATVGEMLDIATDLARNPLPRREIIERAGLEGMLGLRTEALCARRRLWLRFGLAIAGDPVLLVIDEPIEDPDTDDEEPLRSWFRAALRAQAEAGRAVLFAPAEVAAADGVADRLLLVDDGGLVADTTAAELAATDSTRCLSFHAEDIELELVRALPHVVQAQSRQGVFRLHSTDTGATLAALRAQGITLSGLRLHGSGITGGYLRLVHDMETVMGVTR